MVCDTPQKKGNSNDHHNPNHNPNSTEAQQGVLKCMFEVQKNIIVVL